MPFWNVSDRACLRRLALITVVALAILALTSCSGFFTGAELSSISITPTSPVVAKGSTTQFTATGVNDDGSDAGNVTATWSSDNNGIASIDPNGLATGVAAGTATITATSGSFSATTKMLVTNAALNSITVTSDRSTILVNGTAQMKATANLADSSTSDITSFVAWTSSNTSVATVSSTGLVTGVSGGTVTITATAGSVTGQVTLTVTSF